MRYKKGTVLWKINEELKRFVSVLPFGPKYKLEKKQADEFPTFLGSVISVNQEMRDTRRRIEEQMKQRYEHLSTERGQTTQYTPYIPDYSPSPSLACRPPGPSIAYSPSHSNNVSPSVSPSIDINNII